MHSRTMRPSASVVLLLVRTFAQQRPKQAQPVQRVPCGIAEGLRGPRLQQTVVSLPKRRPDAAEQVVMSGNGQARGVERVIPFPPYIAFGRPPGKAAAFRRQAQHCPNTDGRPRPLRKTGLKSKRVAAGIVRTQPLAVPCVRKKFPGARLPPAQRVHIRTPAAVFQPCKRLFAATIGEPFVQLAQHVDVFDIGIDRTQHAERDHLIGAVQRHGAGRPVLIKIAQKRGTIGAFAVYPVDQPCARLQRRHVNVAVMIA